VSNLDPHTDLAEFNGANVGAVNVRELRKRLLRQSKSLRSWRMACPNVCQENRVVFGTSRFYYLEHDQSTDDPLQKALGGECMKELGAITCLVASTFALERSCSPLQRVMCDIPTNATRSAPVEADYEP
jgi:hypothetical protein